MVVVDDLTKFHYIYIYILSSKVDEVHISLSDGFSTGGATSTFISPEIFSIRSGGTNLDFGIVGIFQNFW